MAEIRSYVMYIKCIYTACVCSGIELQLGTYIHTCTNETHSLAPLQDLLWHHDVLL